ncbi:hypothetical protein HN924_02800 [Candidatus Woesearchaeota archaeon]|nr:hypothetical protein [Candidatus Woesearchaeota archaeon]MBT7402742.1 hypothetical protein [Candidatus Woesearchaeota archaeon]
MKSQILIISLLIGIVLFSGCIYDSEPSDVEICWETGGCMNFTEEVTEEIVEEVIDGVMEEATLVNASEMAHLLIETSDTASNNIIEKLNAPEDNDTEEDPEDN